MGRIAAVIAAAVVVAGCGGGRTHARAVFMPAPHGYPTLTRSFRVGVGVDGVFVGPVELHPNGTWTALVRPRCARALGQLATRARYRIDDDVVRVTFENGQFCPGGQLVTVAGGYDQFGFRGEWIPVAIVWR